MKLIQDSDFNSLREKIYLGLNLFHPTKHHSLCATKRKKGLTPPPLVSLLIKPLISFLFAWIESLCIKQK